MNRFTKALFSVFIALLLTAGIIASGIICYIAIGCLIEIITKGGLV